MNNKSLILSIIAVIAIVAAVFLVKHFLYPTIDPDDLIINGQLVFEFSPVNWQDPDNLQQSEYLKESDLPEGILIITATAQGFSPDVFEVEKGQVVSLAVKSGDQWSHSLQFEDEKLKGVVVAIAPSEISATAFYAPNEPGEYIFRCGIAGHTTRGEVGKMIVK